MLESNSDSQFATHAVRRSELAGTRFLATFENADDRIAVQAVAQPARTISAHTDFVREGDATKLLHVVTEGWACRYKTTKDGSRQIVALVVPGDVANLDTLLFGRPDFSVRTFTSTKVVAIACEDMLALAAHHAGVARTLTWLALTENAILSQWALCLGRMSAQQRLAHLFCELGDRMLPGEADDGSSFDMPLTQEQLGDTLGLTAVHVNRTLQSLRGDGLIEIANRSVSFPDASRLRDLAEFDPAYLRHDRVGWADL